MTFAEEALLVISNLPDRAAAESLAHALVERRLAACVNILTPCRSVYRWQGAVEQADEVPLLIKTTRARYAELEAALGALHPYEVPEIIALPLAAGLPAYLDWVGAECARDPKIAC
ncbi:MAG: divalent-cation tolerance protein CutA [Sterolibacteriaceae bacterium]|nr:divalent-cation tolerance protein CutA [Candidatus Methylophosphatis haderslevensis]